jgi:hypothetical protein
MIREKRRKPRSINRAKADRVRHVENDVSRDCGLHERKSRREREREREKETAISPQRIRGGSPANSAASPRADFGAGLASCAEAGSHR